MSGDGSGATVRTFDLELYWPGVSPVAVEELAERVQSVAATMAAAGRPVRFLGATLSLQDEVCFLRLEASRADVDALAWTAKLLDPRVSEVVAWSGPHAPGPASK
ncbi:MAG: hypothetical protein H0U52_01930 [Chloroflexi bacterium]|nr:hypothetical protein [Chloroflexota bacterium]